MNMEEGEIKNKTKLVRKAFDEGDAIKLVFSYNGFTSTKIITTEIAEAFGIPSKELVEITKELTKEYINTNEEGVTELRFYISKYKKTADEIKQEIKETTKKVEMWFSELVKKALEIKERTCIDNWVYEKMVFDWDKQKFIKA